MIQISDCPSGIAAFGIPLRPGSVEHQLNSALLAIRAGASQQAIIDHLRNFHDGPMGRDSSCRVCQLNGLILRAMGRKSLDTEERNRVSAYRSFGTVKIRHIKPGISGAQLRAQMGRDSRVSPIQKTPRRVEELI